MRILQSGVDPNASAWEVLGDGFLMQTPFMSFLLQASLLEDPPQHHCHQAWWQKPSQRRCLWRKCEEQPGSGAIRKDAVRGPERCKAILPGPQTRAPSPICIPFVIYIIPFFKDFLKTNRQHAN